MSRSIALLLLFATLVTPTLAQEPSERTCESEDLQAAIAEARALLDQAEDADIATTLELMADIRTLLITAERSCAPQIDTDEIPEVFTGDSSRMNPMPLGMSVPVDDTGYVWVTEIDWTPGEAGTALVYLHYVCDRPADEVCDPGEAAFWTALIGESGKIYEDSWSATPADNSFRAGEEVYGGGGPVHYTGALGFEVEAESGMVFRFSVGAHSLAYEHFVDVR